MDLRKARRVPLRWAVVPVVPIVLALSSTVLSATAVSAEPKPTVKELTAKADKLNQQLETLAEQYNGLRVRLEQSRRAARSATAEAINQRRSLRRVQSRLRQLAATSYMTGGLDETTAAFAAARDPQNLLDRASALRYFATQNAGQVNVVGAATQAAARAEKAKRARVASVQRLAAETDAKKRRIEKLLGTSKDELEAAVKAEQGGKDGNGDGADKSSPTPTPSPSESGGATAKGLAAVRAAKSKLGARYVWGADGPDTFDCSGLTMWAYKQAGVNLPHYTGSQWNTGTHIAEDQLRPGDLVFFYSDLHHVGMYIGGGNMIHAPQTGDVVRIVPLAGRPYAGAVRVA